MEAKPKCPLWIAITLCAINLSIGLLYSAIAVDLLQGVSSSIPFFTKVPAIVVILIFDVLLILTAMVPTMTVDQFKKNEERMGRLPRIAFLTTSLVSFKFQGFAHLSYTLLDLRTDYERPMKPFFIESPKTIRGIFCRFISTHFCTLNPLSVY